MTLWEIISLPFRRNPRRPLAARVPSRAEMGQEQGKVPLGMEATDMSLINRVTRRNDALERANVTSVNGDRSAFGQASTHVSAMPDDETYTTRYHRAFNEKEKKS